MSFLQYRKTHVRLYEDFTPLDKASRIIPKELFFWYLRTGRFFPLRLRTADSMLSYRLYRLADSVDTDPRQTIKQWGKEEYANFQWQGKELPPHDFRDMTEKRYKNVTTEGKILVVTCWFLDCLPCREEMPELNTKHEQ